METTDHLEPIFRLQVSEIAKQNLQSAAQWGRVMALIGFANLVFDVTTFIKIFGYDGMAQLNGYVLKIIIISGVQAALTFFQYFFLYKYAAYLIKALQVADQGIFTESFDNLRSYFKFIGIVIISTIILGIVSFAIL